MPGHKGIATSPVPGSAVDWNAASLVELIRHIVFTHHEYLRRELPVLNQRLSLVAEVYRERDGKMLDQLRQVLEQLNADLSLHMRKEELILFAAIEACEAAAANGQPLPATPFGSVANPVRMMHIEHADAEEALDRMSALTSGYTVPPHACETYRALIEGLAALSADLRQHIHLENDILFPRAIALERVVDSRMSANFGI